MDHRNAAPALGTRDAGDVRPGDSVVAAEDDRYRTGLGDCLHRLLQIVERQPPFDARHLDVARIENSQVAQRIHAEGQVGARRIVWVVIGGADHLGTETSARAVRGACVIRGTDDDDVSARKARGLVEVASGHSQESHIGAVHATDARSQRADSRASWRFRQLRITAKLIASKAPVRNMNVPITLTCGGTPRRVAP